MRVPYLAVVVVTALAALTIPTAWTSVTASAQPPTVRPPISPCAAPPSADVATADGWIGYLARHSGDYGLDITTLDGQVITHHPNEPLPTASAIKLLHLAAFANAVATNTLRADDSVSVAQWEQWYFPLDGNAHRDALRYLGIPEVNGVAVDRDSRVTYRQLADVMIRFSDSAAPDLLRHRVGDPALRSLMRTYELGDDLPSLLGLYLGLVDPAIRTAAQRDSAAYRYRTDPSYAAAMVARIATMPRTPHITNDSTITASPRSLSRLMAAIADGRLGPGATIARSILEYQGAQPDGGTLGFKGGSLPGILTEVFEYRLPDGRSAVGTFMVRNLSANDQSRDNFAHQRLLLGALTDPSIAARLRCVV